MTKNILIVKGGKYAEAEVSRKTAINVETALKARGYNTTSIEPQDNLISYLNDKGIKNIYVTGDVVKGKIINRLFSKNELIEESESDFYENKVHGTGCAISMAILCYLSSGDSLEVACKKSHSLMNNLVKNSYTNKSQNILNFS